MVGEILGDGAPESKCRFVRSDCICACRPVWVVIKEQKGENACRQLVLELAQALGSTKNHWMEAEGGSAWWAGHSEEGGDSEQGSHSLDIFVLLTLHFSTDVPDQDAWVDMINSIDQILLL